MEEEYLGDIFQDASETLEDENIQQLRISLKIGGNFCPNIRYHQYNERRFQAEWVIDVPHLQGARSGGVEGGGGGGRAEEEGGEGEGNGNGEIGEDEEDTGGEGDDNEEIGEEEDNGAEGDGNEEIGEEEENDGGEGDGNEEIGEEEENDGGEGDNNEQIGEEEENDGGEGDGNEEIGEEEENDGGEGDGNEEIGEDDENDGGEGDNNEEIGEEEENDGGEGDNNGEIGEDEEDNGGEGDYNEEIGEEEDNGGEGDGNEEIGEGEENDGGEGDGNEEIREEEENNGGEGDNNEQIGEEEENDGGEGDGNEEIGEEEENDGGEGDGNEEIGEEEENDGGEGDGNEEIGEDDEDDGGGDSNEEIGEDDEDDGGEEDSNEEIGEDEEEERGGGEGTEGGLGGDNRGGDNDDSHECIRGRGRGGGENDRGEANVGGHPHLPLPYNIIGRCSAMKYIFRVPKYIRVIEKRTYTPQTVSIGPSPYTPKIVSIGPYHYGNPKLSRMECKKKLLFTSLRIDPKCQSSLTATMTKFEAKARKCYSTKFNSIDTNTFRDMMLIDAFFIIHTFLSFNRWCKNLDDPKLQGEPIFQTAWRQGNICEDLLMLENQLPFFILVKVYAILSNESDEEESGNCLKKLAMQFFKQVEFGRSGGGGDDFDSETVTAVADNPKHLLDLFHSSFVVAEDKRKTRKRNNINTNTSSSSKYWVSSASALRSNGVKFIATKKGNPLDIQFNHYLGRLRVPTLCINDRTATVLKNLVAYEQGSRLPNPYFTTLAIFFSNIAPNADDIKLLREAHIINHQSAGDGAVVLLLQQLYKASQNGFNACLIKHHLQLIDRYLISGQAQVMSSLRKRGGAAQLGYNFVASLLISFFTIQRIRL